MITKIQAYKSSDGSSHCSLEEAQKYEIKKLFNDHPAPDDESKEWSAPDIAAHIFECRDKIIDILTTKENSLPRARKINGGTKKRKPTQQSADLLPMTPPNAA